MYYIDLTENHYSKLECIGFVDNKIKKLTPVDYRNQLQVALFSFYNRKQPT